MKQPESKNFAMRGNKRVWLRLRDPREVTAGFGVMWVVLFTVAIASLTSPSHLAVHGIPPDANLVWSTFLLIGSLLGFMGCVLLREPWWRWVERSGIAAAFVGVGLYLFLIVFAHLGPKLVPLGFVSLALLMLGARWTLMKYVLTLRPLGNAHVHG